MATTQWQWQRLTAGPAGGAWQWLRLSLDSGAPLAGAWQWQRLSVSTGAVPPSPGGAWQWLRLAVASGHTSAPTADLGGAVTNIDAFSTVTLDCSDSFDIDGTVTAYTLTQTSGPLVTELTGVGPTFTYKAPGVIAGTAVGWQLVVTDNDGLNSPAVSVVHSILPVNEMAAVGGVWVPVEMSLIGQTADMPPEPAANAMLNPAAATADGWMSAWPTRWPVTLDATSPISGATSVMTTRTSDFSPPGMTQWSSQLVLTGGAITTALPMPGYVTDEHMMLPEFRVIPLTPGEITTWTISVKVEQPSRRVGATLFFFDDAGVVIDSELWGSANNETTVANEVVRLGDCGPVPAGAHWAWLRVWVYQPDGQDVIVGERVWYDNLLITFGPDHVGVISGTGAPGDPLVFDPDAYVDGDTPGYHWAGTPGASATVKD